MKSINLSLKGKNVKLIPYDEKHINYIYNHIMESNIEGFEKCKIIQKKDLYKFIDKVDKKLLIKNINNDKIVGYVAGYDYNKVDGYIYITAILEEQKEFNIEALKLFITYLFTCFPIRKIYCDIYENNTNKLDILKEIGFNTEAILQKDTFYDGNYYDKMILSLYREDYSYE